MNNFRIFTKHILQIGLNNPITLNKKLSSKAMEKTVQISGQTINYLKVGKGERSILCFPGALGTIWSDFKPQIEQIDKKKFTIVAFDPPGYGLSRPPNRKFDVNFYKTDAKFVHDLMKTIGINKFSLLGWSDGGISSMILAAEYPESIDKLVVWGANAYLLPEDIQVFDNIRDTKNWSAKAKEPLIKLYGEDGLQNMWTNWCDTMQELSNKNKGNICMEFLAKIKCPTLILHGVLDPMIASEHPGYLNTHIKDSVLHIFPKGKHNIHLRYAEEFNAIVTNFILTGKL